MREHTLKYIIHKAIKEVIKGRDIIEAYFIPLSLEPSKLSALF